MGTVMSVIQAIEGGGEGQRRRSFPKYQLSMETILCATQAVVADGEKDYAIDDDDEAGGAFLNDS